MQIITVNKKVSFNTSFFKISSANVTAFIPQINEMKKAKNPKFLHANCITPIKLGIINHGNNLLDIINAIMLISKKLKYISLYSFFIFL